jgi:DnaJ domain
MTAAEALLGIALPAPLDEVKRAYRRQISRYHPDKVHHLGEEFQVLAAEKSAQLTEVYRRLLEANGSDEQIENVAVPATTSRDEPRVEDVSAPPPVNRMSSWQAVAAGCPSLILTAAIDRVSQAVQLTLPRADEFTVPGFSAAWRTRADWRDLLKRRPIEGVLLRTPADLAVDRQRVRRIRHLVSGVDGAIVIVDLVVGPLAIEPPPSNARPLSSRGERDVYVVTLDAMTWKASMPPEAPAIAHLILARVRDSRT